MKNKKSLTYLSTYLFLLYTTDCFQFAAGNATYLEEGKTMEQKGYGGLQTFCYKGRLKHIVNMWETVHLSLSPNDYSLFDGYSAEEVITKYEQQRNMWNFNFFTKRQYIKLNPFNHTCVGIVSNKDYTVKLHRIRVDYWRILLCFCGFALFVSAPSLSTNPIFYYLTGISFGVFASILVFVYLLSRLMPRKPVMYSFLAGGWTIGIYLVQLLWENVRVIAIDYKTYVFYYILGTGLISFIICYRYGPVSDPKSINLIRWSLRGAAMLMVFLSSDFQEAAMSLNFILLIYYNLPLKRILNLFYRIKKWWFPPELKLLTEDEYHQQGAIETEKALDHLRSYCSSPECNQWRTVLKLKDPLRFAKFMEGASHLRDDEVLAFETNTRELRTENLLTSDSSSEDDS